MVGLVQRPQIVAVDVRVELRGREVRVAQHFLHGAKVRAALEQVRRERVPEGVRRSPLRQPGGAGRSLDDAPRAPPRRGRAVAVETPKPASLPFAEAWEDLAAVQRHRPERPPAHRHDALLRALPEHAGEPILVQDVLQLQPHELGHTRASGIREFEQCAVADPERLVGIGRREQAFDLGDRQDGRQAAPLPWRLPTLARVARGMALADQIAVVRADRRDLAPNGRRGETQVFEGVHELAQQLAGHVLRAAGALGAGIAGEPPDVADVVRHGVRAVARFQGEKVAELLDAERRFGRQIHRRTRALYARYSSPNLRSRYVSSRAMTERRTSAMTTGRKARGHGSFRSRVPPTYRMAMPTYIGLRVNRYGPHSTSAEVGLAGLGVVPALRNRYAELRASSTPATISPQPSRLSTAVGCGHKRIGRSPGAPYPPAKPPAEMGGGGKRTPGGTPGGSLMAEA